jgi:radical SAM protein with 4Fe4S-binding SPASM domain
MVEASPAKSKEAKNMSEDKSEKLPKDCMECKHAPCYFQSCPYAWYEHKQRRVKKK